MSEINDEWSENQKQEDTVDFEGKGTTPPRPVEQSDNANNLNNLDNLHSNRQQTPHQIDQQGQKDQQDHSDYPASYSHSNQNDNPQGCIVHVSHMHVGVDDQLLTEHMSSSGKVLKVVIMLDPHTRESRGFGFVTFENPSEADDAIEKLHLSQILGKTITVARARRGRPREPTPGQYIGPPKYDRSMSARPQKPRYQPYPSPRDHGGYDRNDRYERGPPRYAARYHPYHDRYDRYGCVYYSQSSNLTHSDSGRRSYPPPSREYSDYPPPPKDYYGSTPYKPYPRGGPPHSLPYKPYKPMGPRDRYDDYSRPPRGPPRDYSPRSYPPRDYPPRDFPPRDDFDRPPRRFTPRNDYRDDYRPGPTRDYPPRDYPPRDYLPRDYPPRDYPPRDYDGGFKKY
ncbi:hypothetical protein E3P89_01268 [Wallemia ichthyophaga]|uniref:RRM domain-containing protein n=1 Tax=Wallemia ichthyophaga TaxID=245174 RepID=A0A4T0GJB3_WALIC|nr:hypothetical protein E3P95_01139 [Wallemia ichthyophaga]TIB02902.1 hypothetical protein E3P94_01271 [Wallemia ichthyophaga]TIB13478.1 hypothetical protein E3P90_01668 [Wallemia ichthyophaga]TIB15251.1 hypothetical protein E3P93_01418 [Wallemia ichthyophaga]TIB24028.1 hypothetical protein E3P89_01268 [Wallemia ichthyophaga]